jgi:hypothetical protein
MSQVKYRIHALSFIPDSVFYLCKLSSFHLAHLGPCGETVGTSELIAIRNHMKHFFGKSSAQIVVLTLGRFAIRVIRCRSYVVCCHAVWDSNNHQHHFILKMERIFPLQWGGQG